MRCSPHLYLHLAYPKETQWSIIFQHISTRLGLPLVSYEHWLELLEENSFRSEDISAARDNPASVILDFFRRAAKGTSKEAMAVPRLSLEKAKGVSPTLRDPKLPLIDSLEVDGWLRSWRDSGFLSN